MQVDLKLDKEYDGFLFLAENVRNPPSLRSHRHDELELNVVSKGNVTYVTGEGRFRFPARTLLWMFPAQEHRLVDRSDDAAYYVAVFKPGLIQQFCRSSQYRELKRRRPTKPGVLCTQLNFEDFQFLKSLMERVMLGSLDPDLLNREAGYGDGSDFRYRHNDPDALNAGLHHLLLLCWAHQLGARVGTPAVALHPAVERALSLLENSSSDCGLQSLGRKCGLSPARLSRLFASQVGIPLTRYRNSLRLSRFWEEARRPVRPTMLEAAFAAGFGSYAQFYKSFTAAYGESPRRALASQRKQPPAASCLTER